MNPLELYSQVDDLEKQALVEDLQRHLPVFTSSAQGRSLLSLLEDNLLKWLPADYRLSPTYRAKHNLQYGPENPFLLSIYQGLELKVQRRLPLESKVELAILIPSNLSGLESYNKEAEEHNNNWVKHGSLSSIFDPKHLEEAPVNGPVEPVSYSSKHTKSLDLSQLFHGRLRSLPAMDRTQVATIIAQVEIIEEEFKVRYCVENNSGEILYYNVLIERDLSLIGRKIHQESFGNPFQTSQTYVENLLEGIPQLLQGKKTKIAEQENTKPSWVNGSLKSISPRVIVDTVLSHTYETTGRVFTYLGAFASLVVATPLFWSGFMHGISMEPSWDLELGLATIIGGTAASWYAGRLFYKNAEVKTRNNYLRF